MTAAWLAGCPELLSDCGSGVAEEKIPRGNELTGPGNRPDAVGLGCWLSSLPDVA